MIEGLKQSGKQIFMQVQCAPFGCHTAVKVFVTETPAFHPQNVKSKTTSTTAISPWKIKKMDHTGARVE